MAGPSSSVTGEPISLTLTLPFSLNDVAFLVAILALAALIGLAAWLAHVWPVLSARLTKLPRLHKRASLNALFWVLAGLFASVFVILSLFGLWAAFVVLTGIIRGDTLSSTGAGTMGTAAVLIVAVLGAPFVIWRAIVAQKTVNVAKQGLITDRINKAVEALGAEKSVKQVVEQPRFRKDAAGNWLRDDEGKPVPETLPDGTPFVDREVIEKTQPNLEVRIGAIYALERIAQDSLRDHIQIMEILCAYIRENAPASRAPKLPEPPVFDAGDVAASKEALERWKADHRGALATGGRDGGPVRPREDIQVALTVIGRRGPKQIAKEQAGAPSFAQAVGAFPIFPAPMDGGALDAWTKAAGQWKEKKNNWMKIDPPYKLDLRRTDLAGADLKGAHFDYVLLAVTRLDGAILRQAHLNGADLRHAHLNGADFFEAQLSGATLSGAQLNGAYLSDARLNGANLSHSQFNGADLEQTEFNGAKLQDAQLNGANLWDAQFNGADLTQAQLIGAILKGARLNGADLSWTLLNGAALTKSQLAGAMLSETLLKFTIGAPATVRAASVQSVDLSRTGLSMSQIVTMFGDASVRLPGGVTPEHPDWPSHWPRKKLEESEFRRRWTLWKSVFDAASG